MTEALNGAMDVFWRHGYAGAPIQELCMAMGLNPGSVYAAFGNKRGLFLAVLKHYIKTMNHPGLEMMKSNPGGMLGIRDYFGFISDGICTGNRGWGCLGTNALIELEQTDPDVRAIMGAHLDTLEAAFHDALKRDSIPKPGERAKYLLCFSQGLNVVAKTSFNEASLRTTINAALAPLEAQPVAVE